MQTIAVRERLKELDSAQTNVATRTTAIVPVMRSLDLRYQDTMAWRCEWYGALQEEGNGQDEDA